MTFSLTSFLQDKKLGPLLLTAGAGWSSRFVAAITQFAAIRLLTDRLGVDGYGAFAVVTGLLAWFMLADLGFGAAIQNHISHARVDGLAWRPVVQRISRRLGGALVVIWLAIAAIAPLAGPYLLARYHSISTGDSIVAFAAFGALSSATGALSVILKIQFAEHRGYIAHTATGVGAALGLALLAMTGSLPIEHMLVWSIIAYYLPGVVLPLLLFARFLRRTSHEQAAVMVPTLVVSQARVFLLFATLSALILNADYIILSRAVSSSDLLIYAIISKAYALIYILYNSILQAYWPVSAEAMRRSDASTVRSLIYRCIAIGAAIVIGGTLAFIAAVDRIALLLAPTEHPVIPALLILAFAAYWLVRVWTDIFGIVIMSSGQVGYLCRIVPLQALVSVPAAYVGASLFGITGLIAGLSLGYLTTVAWMMPRHIYRHLKSITELAA